MTRTALFLSIAAALLLMGNPPHAATSSSPTTADWVVSQNPVSGNAEAVWSSPVSTTTVNILYSVLDGPSWAPSTSLSVLGKIDTSPVLAFDSAGGRAIVWQTASNAIAMKTQAYGSSTWSVETTMSDASENVTNPSVAIFNGKTLVSYETIPTQGSRSVKVAALDPGSHVERVLVASTTSSSPLLAEIHTESTHVWIDWIDSGTSLGFSVFLGGNWTSPAYETYSEPDDIKNARERVKEFVMSGQ